MDKVGDCLLRAVGTSYGSISLDDMEAGGSVWLVKWPIVQITPRGCWVEKHGMRKFVLSGSGKRWAHATKKEALECFVAKKRRQLIILRNQQHSASLQKQCAERLLVDESKVEIDAD